MAAAVADTVVFIVVYSDSSTYVATASYTISSTSVPTLGCAPGPVINSVICATEVSAIVGSAICFTVGSNVSCTTLDAAEAGARPLQCQQSGLHCRRHCRHSLLSSGCRRRGL